MWLLILFIAVPVIEIGLFIQVGGAIGLFPTLAIVILTAVLGTWLVRSQGLAALMSVQTSFNKLENPTEPLAHGAMILLAGALLLTPGFFTDAVGFLLLTPAFRVAAFQFLKSRVSVASFQMGAGPQQGFQQRDSQGNDIIDGDFVEIHESDSQINNDRRH